MKTKIPLTRLWVNESRHQEAATNAIGRVLKSGKFVLGSEVEAFEREYSTFLGLSSGVGVGSGTDAITLGLMAGGIQTGDEVLVPAFAPSATASAIIATGATPVLVDVTPDFGLDLEQVRAALTARTRAVVVVHLFGGTDDMTRILAVAKAHNLWVVEDCAHAHGARHWDHEIQQWRLAGTMGNVGAFSFYPTKNLGGIGDGGFCSSGSAAVVEKLRRLRQYGWQERDNSTHSGRNSRLDEIQASVLRCALKHLEHWNAQRRVLARAYLDAFSAARIQAPMRLPSLETHRHHVFHQFVVRVAAREHVRRLLDDHGVEYGIHYPRALSQQSAFKAYTGGRHFPVAERTAAEVLSLPMHPSLSEDEIHYIVSALNDLRS